MHPTRNACRWDCCGHERRRYTSNRDGGMPWEELEQSGGSWPRARVGQVDGRSEGLTGARPQEFLDRSELVGDLMRA